MAGRVASRSWAWSARRAVIAKGMAATGLLSIGVCLGVVVGSLFDGPRLFVRGLTLATQRVELPPSSAVLELEALEAFSELQRRAQTEQHACEDRNTEGKQKHPDIDGHLGRPRQAARREVNERRAETGVDPD